MNSPDVVFLEHKTLTMGWGGEQEALILFSCHRRLISAALQVRGEETNPHEDHFLAYLGAGEALLRSSLPLANDGPSLVKHNHSLGLVTFTEIPRQCTLHVFHALYPERSTATPDF